MATVFLHQYPAWFTENLGVILEPPAKCQHRLFSVLCSFAVSGVDPQRGALPSFPRYNALDRGRTSPQEAPLICAMGLSTCQAQHQSGCSHGDSKGQFPSTVLNPSTQQASHTSRCDMVMPGATGQGDILTNHRAHGSERQPEEKWLIASK